MPAIIFFIESPLGWRTADGRSGATYPMERRFSIRDWRSCPDNTRRARGGGSGRPVGLALLDERLHTLERRRLHHVARHRAAGVLVRGGGAGLDLPIEELLAERDRDARLGDDRGDDRFDLGVER